MLVGFASGRTEFKDVATDALGRLKVGLEALFSTLGRTAARGLETRLCAGWLLEEFDHLVANLKAGHTSTADTKSWSPDTWNASPKDTKSQHRAYEAALIGTPMADPKRPVEILRTIHSWRNLDSSRR
jgi:hydrogenase large subunit